MPLRPMRPCAQPGCPNLVRSGYCADHLRARPQRDRAIHRLYSTTWKKRRKAQLAKEPWCAEHLAMGEYIPATDVDHIVPHRGDPYLFFTGELQSLCHPCHSAKTRKEAAHVAAG
jgi:5-methylcytosine-specific restriction protein A